MTTVERVLSFDYFMSLSNIIKELTYFGAYDPIQVWEGYCKYIEKSESHKQKPIPTKGFQKISGFSLEGLQELYKERGLALVLMHYGNYRYTKSTILNAIMKIKAEKPVLLVVDEESYKSESQFEVIAKLYSELNIQMIIAENASSGLRIARHLKNGGIVVLYLDGMTGYGKDKSPIRVPFISSEISLRSGFFRLLEKTQVPVIGAISPTDDELLISLPIISDKFEATASSLMSFFRQTLLADPSQWRLWYRHHLFVEGLPNTMNMQKKPNTTTWICNQVSPKIMLEEETGDVYQYMETN
ncbi:hypothetical protein [Priestia taiwanensis]|uniref:Uncharacterized protein n=1 Tax=Priestia taiwanensis TaxID=1347902 RepID=A0A917ART8_9BACI|nr:hypothetical protein [Priestia taiwanensis]MBM7363857.1 lauroyl/myristoyl acyltransferase [Priestia taiwanensis]GGE69557.1 hypothetical protein GCM10007140_19510 [Priestia taiwanensis]